MKSCEQTEGQSIYEHGLDVWRNFIMIYNSIKFNQKPNNGVIIPDWAFEHREVILDRLFPLDTIKEYLIYHDCGKPFCLETDENGKRHFPNHAQVSYETWLSISGNGQTANLILHDMDVHKLKSEDVESFARMSEAATLLLAGLAEINSNAKMFGGFASTSFKIKYKHLNKKGKKICSLL